jgi:outer membrane phospholipase A
MVPKESSWFTWMGARLAFQHESNGRSGTDSRSLNTVYLRPRFVLGTLDAWFLVVIPEFQAYVGDVADNPAIKDYRGYGKLRLYVGRNDGPTLMFSGWTGRDFDHGTYQLDLTWPLHVPWLNIETYLQAQYFNGYGESLRAYDQKSEALRVGFGLVR